MQTSKKTKVKVCAKAQKGITLIALVVTIVVLLILAGVSLNAVFSDSGIIKQAQKAQEKWNEAEKSDLEGINSLNDLLNSYVDGTGITEGNTTGGTTETGKVTKITLSQTAGKIIEGSHLTLVATVEPSTAENKTVTWSSSAESIATVSSEGVVTAVSEGSATITATAADGSGVTATYEATVGKLTYTETASTSTEYVTYYADLNGDGKITEDKDGIIFADLLLGDSGIWNPEKSTLDYSTTGGTWSYSAISGTKKYVVSEESYTGTFGTKQVIKASGTTGKDRFYVMALSDITNDTISDLMGKTTSDNAFTWYAGAYINGISDYATVTKVGFGEGKTNTTNMISKWKKTSEGGYGVQNLSVGYLDIWGVVKAINEQEGAYCEWFVPSANEWAAFGSKFEITKSNYNKSYGLEWMYHTSSLFHETYAYFMYFWTGYMATANYDYHYYLRLATTF